MKCCVVSCKNSQHNTNEKIKFYTFPKTNYKAAQCLEWTQWVQKTNGTPDWKPEKHTRICSSHFVGNCSSTISTSPSYVPSIIKRKGLHLRCVEKSAIQRFDRFMKRRMYTTQHKKSANERRGEDNTLINVSEVSLDENNFSGDHQNEILLDVPTHIDKGIQVEFFDNSWSDPFNGTAMFVCTQYVHNDVCEAQTQVFIPKKRITSECATKMITFDKCCGPRIVQVEKAVGPDNPDSIDKGFNGVSSVRNDQEILDLGGVSLATFAVLLKALSNIKETKLSRENKLFIFLMKMKTGLTFSAIGLLFRVHRTTASRIFRTVLRTLRDACNHIIAWPCREVVRETMPNDFLQSFQDCRVIIDCTEIKLEQPNTIENRIFTYSHYKKGFTTKILVGCTPSGLISFISPCYGGRTSDCQITIESGILDLLEPGDVVLADKGFPAVQTVLDETGKGALVVMPPFLHNGHFSAEEVEKTYRIARVRIHIERIMQRLRVYKILDKFASDMFPLADSIVFMCAVLVNFQPPIIKDGDIDETQVSVVD